jgi:hypothetical protein
MSDTCALNTERASGLFGLSSAAKYPLRCPAREFQSSVHSTRRLVLVFEKLSDTQRADNNRIQFLHSLNQCCAPASYLESMLLTRSKNLFRQHRSDGDERAAGYVCLVARSGHQIMRPVRQLEAKPQADTGTVVRPITIAIAVVRSVVGSVTVPIAIVGSVIRSVITVPPIVRTVAVTPVPITDLLNVSSTLGIGHR